MTPSQLPIFQNQLLNWFANHQRPLPWRKTYAPYAVWVSEIMLQQTQVATVLPYFERWMETLPTLQAVADAPDALILKLWEGLGYYSRARNLQKAARWICEQHQGLFPEKLETLLKLPGIGRYTAGAIASIAFNQNAPIVDGNITRVVCRLMDFRDNPKSAEMSKILWQLAEQWIPQGKARFFNQGLMELGATLCLPQQPHCLICPVQNFCKAWQSGSVEEVPAKIKRRALTPRTTALAVIQNENTFFIRKRPLTGLMGGLWEFPNVNLNKNESMQTALMEAMKQQYQIEMTIIRPLMTIQHAYTSFKITLHCFLCHYCGHSTPKAVASTKWVALDELEQFSFPSAHKKLIQTLRQQPTLI